jgi:iron complex outermembrane receptor protein
MHASGFLHARRATPLALLIAFHVLVGINSSYYGPNASRPVIRGLDGDRVQILQNGLASFDASGTSVDHAVPIDTLTVKRIEVVRGPAVLL